MAAMPNTRPSWHDGRHARLGVFLNVAMQDPLSDVERNKADLDRVEHFEQRGRAGERHL